MSKKILNGFIDLQVNGYLGVDFSSKELSEEKFIWASLKLLNNGTLAFLPTLITSSKSLYKKNLRIISKCMEHKELKNRILGIHLEGPFISEKDGAVGAHNKKHTRKPSIKFLKKLIKYSNNNIKLITLAPELENSKELIDYANKHNITVSAGHHLANLVQITAFSNNKGKALTHFGNGIPNFLPRHENGILSGLLDSNLSLMLVGDGHHLPKSFIELVKKMKKIEKLIFVSDASPISGLKAGNYTTLGNNVVLEENGKLHNKEKKCLVGSSATMIECANFLLQNKIVTLKDLYIMMYKNPLKLINIKNLKVIPLKKMTISTGNNKEITILKI